MSHLGGPRTAGALRWYCLPEYRDALLGPEGLRLPEWLKSGAAEVVKHGPHRTVYRVRLEGDGLDFYVKHYRVGNLRAWLRELVRPSKARTEYERTRAVADRQVPTFLPLAFGERRPGRGPGDSFLITRTLEEIEPLGPFVETVLPTLPPARRTRLRQRLAEALGALLAQLHDAGITHHDLHAGNLLLRLETDDRPTLYLIDLHTVTVGAPLRWPARRDNLVMLNRWFVLRASRSDRYRFWRGYLRSLACGETLSRDSAPRELERRTWLSNLRFWRHRDRRCLATNRYFQRLRGPGVRGHAVRDLDPALLASLLHDPDEPFRREGIVLRKDSPSSTVAEWEFTSNGVRRQVIYKRFRVTAWHDPWLALCRRTAAVRSWVFGHGLRDRGLPTPRPLLVLHRHRGGLPAEGYLLTEKVPDSLELHRFVASLSSLPFPERRMVLRRGIDAVAGLIRDLHQRRLAHRDLKAANILVSSSPLSPAGRGEQEELPVVFSPPSSVLRPPSSAWQIGPKETDVATLWLIDLVGVRRYRKLPRRRRVQNLARLHASFLRCPALTRTDKLRFLRVYLQWGLRGRDTWKRWWREVERATQAKVKRNLRSGRPLT